MVDEVTGDEKGFSPGIGILKGTGVREYSNVEVGSDLWCQLDLERLSKFIDHLSHGGRRIIQPVEICKGFRLGVVVNADDEVLIKALKVGPLQVIALQDEQPIVVPFNLMGDLNPFDSGKRLIGTWVRICIENMGGFTQFSQHQSQSQLRPDRISVGAGMRGNHEPIVIFNKLDYVVQSLHS